MKALCVVVATLPLFLIACEDKPAAPAGPGAPAGTPAPTTPTPPAAGVDTSSPTATTTAFLAAVKAKDKAKIAACISPSGTGDVRGLKMMSTSDKDLTDLADMLKDATPGLEDQKADKAEVELKNARRIDRIVLVKEDGQWLIKDI